MRTDSHELTRSKRLLFLTLVKQLFNVTPSHKDTHTHSLSQNACIWFLELVTLLHQSFVVKASGKVTHDALCSLPLITGIVSNRIIHSGNPRPVVLSLLLSHSPLRAEAGEVEE